MGLRPGKTKGPYVGISPSSIAAMDTKAKVTTNDTTTSYLNSKIVAGTGITKTVLNPGGNETLEISAPGSTTDEKVRIGASDTTPGFLFDKLPAGSGISVSVQNIGANESMLLSADDKLVKVSAADTTHNYLDSKIVVSGAVTKTILNPGGAETLQLSVPASTDINAKVSAADTTTGYLNTKITVGTGLTKSITSPAGDERLNIALTTTQPTKVRVLNFFRPDDVDIEGGAVITDVVTPTHSNRFRIIELPEGSDFHFDFPMNGKYIEADGIYMYIHWLVVDGSHGTQHTLTRRGHFYNNNSNLDVAQSINDWIIQADAANYIKYIDGVGYTPGGVFNGTGTNLHVTIGHKTGCAGSGAIKVLGLEIYYNVSLE